MRIIAILYPLLSHDNLFSLLFRSSIHRVVPVIRMDTELADRGAESKVP